MAYYILYILRKQQERTQGYAGVSGWQGLWEQEIRILRLYEKKDISILTRRISYGNGGREEPERFYHGFVLGLMVELADRYVITSNRESGFGRYDLMLEPRKSTDDAVVIEFKVQDEEEKELSDTVQNALRQIEEQACEAALVARGIPKERIRKL